MKIYEYNEAIEACLNSNAEGVDEETGLVFDSALLDRLDMERDEKLENLILYEEQLKLDAAELKDYADKLIARAKAKKNKAESLKAWLCDEITRYGAKKFESVKISCHGKAKHTDLRYEPYPTRIYTHENRKRAG